jgi:hypothetical protein
MFRTAFPSHHQVFKTVHTEAGICQTDTAVCMLASGQQSLFGCCMYSLELLMMDGKTVRNMLSFIKKRNKIGTLVHLIGFTVEIYHEARPYVCQIPVNVPIFLNANLNF